MAFTPLLRQFLVAMSTFLAAFSVGGAMSFPTLIIEHFKSNDTAMPLDIGTTSWIGSIYGLAGIPAILMPIIAQTIGRKYGFIITSFFLIIGWTLAITATNVTELLISESFHGLGTNSIMPISFLGITEMLAPKYRFLSLQTFGVIQILGLAVCGIVGRFLHYKTVSIIMLIPIAVGTAMALLWSESPSWLACKGEFQKCENVFVKLRGRDDASKQELNNLIAAQRENFTACKTVSLARFCEKVSRRDFYVPMIHIFVLMTMMYWSGCDVVIIYFIDMVSKSTNDERSTFYASIVMYLIVWVGSIVTNILVLKYKNKAILLSSVSGVIICLLFGCIVTTLQYFEVINRTSYLLIFVLLAFMTCGSLGLDGMVFMIGSELIPVRHRNLGGSLFIIFNCLLYASSLKLYPYLFFYMGMHGTFFVYLISTLLCALFVWRYIPETKGKTLQQIEDYYVYGRFISRYCEESSAIRNQK